MLAVSSPLVKYLLYKIMGVGAGGGGSAAAPPTFGVLEQCSPVNLSLWLWQMDSDTED